MQMTLRLEHLHSFLVHPAKADERPPTIGGAHLPRDGKLGTMLGHVFERASSECNVEIVFCHDSAGRQKNACRSDLLTYLKTPSVENGRIVAQRLQVVTTHKSGLGLLFLLAGRDGSKRRLVISRFPADQGILAEEDREALSVSYIERVFMKNAHAYKSVVYESDSLTRGFWDGRAIDKQLGGGPRELSDYWIKEFLSSELRTTGPAGTKRMALALQRAILDAPDLPVRQELVAAAQLLPNFQGQAVSGRSLANSLGLSQTAVATWEHGLSRSDLMDETFMFHREEFLKVLPYKAVQLDNGALLLARSDQFDETFTQEPAGRNGIRFSTEGHVTDERLRRSR